jgi:C-terminal processing protease CtpA/Prc
MRIRAACTVPGILLLVFMASFLTSQQKQQQMTSLERGRALDMLQVTASDVKKHYYDPKFHGVDFDAKVGEARQQIQTSTAFNMAMSHIAAMLDTLNDSHTFFVPPQHAYRHDYGFTYQMTGDRCFVTHVRPGSDAEKKGLKPGDEILTINGYNVTRDDYWKVQYVFNILRPQPGLHLQLADAPGVPRQFDVLARMRDTKRVTDLTGGGGASDIWDLIREQENQDHLMRARYFEVGDQLMVLQVPEFFFTIAEVDSMIGKARKFPNLIVDLRGNPGGSVETLKYLVGGVFDKEVKIADRAGRKDTKPEIARSSHNPYGGKVLVLVDSKSASAAELFARVIQLEKRGKVAGDRSSGSVMESKRYDEKVGADTVIFYGASITEWDLIMSDGKSLEHTGVTPDEIILPNASDLASGKDPVLARAAEMLGVKLTPEDAGKAFPYEWGPE